jgi:hypothetical protein
VTTKSDALNETATPFVTLMFDVATVRRKIAHHHHTHSHTLVRLKVLSSNTVSN